MEVRAAENGTFAISAEQEMGLEVNYTYNSWRCLISTSSEMLV